MKFLSNKSCYEIRCKINENPWNSGMYFKCKRESKCWINEGDRILNNFVSYRQLSMGNNGIKLNGMRSEILAGNGSRLRKFISTILFWSVGDN